jgi:RimJ/RimL family protein N-acetyltransferase
MSKWPKIDLKSRWGRLVLIPPRPEDDDEVAALRSDPEALRYLPFEPKSMSAEDCRARREAQAKDDERWDFHIHLTSPLTPAPSTFVGQCGITHIDLPNLSGEIGIAISSRLHRTGIATEALYVVLSHAFEHPELKLHRLQFVTASNNVQMRGWLESFEIEQEHRIREAWADGHGGWLDGLGYSILEAEWPALKTRLEARLAARGIPSGTVV